jgi:hypothetical protein
MEQNSSETNSNCASHISYVRFVYPVLRCINTALVPTHHYYPVLRCINTALVLTHHYYPVLRCINTALVLTHHYKSPTRGLPPPPPDPLIPGIPHNICKYHVFHARYIVHAIGGNCIFVRTGNMELQTEVCRLYVVHAVHSP